MARVKHFFHGTNHDLAVGDEVLPAAESGVVQAHPLPHRQESAYDPRNWAHASSSENVAWGFAERAADFNHRGAGRRTGGREMPAPGGTPRARVYKVEPLGQVRMGVENRRHPEHRSSGSGIDSQEWLSKRFRVVEQIDIHPPADLVYVNTGKKTRSGYTQTKKTPNVWGQQGTLPIDWSPYAPGKHPARVNHPGFYDQNPEHGPYPPAKETLAPRPHEEVAGQQAMFPVPKKTGIRKLKQIRAGRG